ncbi:MAG: hypothetical protein PVSMB1_04680 [Gemmatimonadaceae bacterium]
MRFAIGLVMITAGAGTAMADFASDRTPVDMRSYWPVSYYSVATLRRGDGTLYMKRITKTNDPMGYWLPAPQSGEVRFSREDYIPDDYAPVGGNPAADPVAYFKDSWSMAARPDWSVSEIADSFAFDYSYCTTWCASSGQYYPGGDIVHARPWGHTLGESYYYKVWLPVYRTPNLQTTAPSVLNGWHVYSVIRMEQKYNWFNPEYGRSNGTWSYGNGQWYSNVVLMVLQHGVSGDPSYPNGKSCSNMPSGIGHYGPYTSFWVYTWYAPGVGPIKESLLFDERTCQGAMAPAPGFSPGTYDVFIDNG